MLFEEWQTRFESYADALERDEFFRAHWDRLYTINCDDLGRGFLPGCYTSLTPNTFDRRLHRACAYPYSYNELTITAAETRREHLFSFRGTDASHSIRREMFRLLGDHPRGKMSCVRTPFHSHDEAQKRAYVHDILASCFALCPRGWSPASYRVFEVMELGRCPVIISDEWIPVDGPRWEECSIRVKQSEIPRIPKILAGIEEEAERLGQAARMTWEAHFSEKPKFQSMLRQLGTIHQQRDTSDYRKRWRSRKFRSANRWLLGQRLLDRLRRDFGRRFSQ